MGRPVRPYSGRRVPGYQPAAILDPAGAETGMGAGLTVVGDDAQSIYGFRAATVRNILDFPARFTPPATIVTLDHNYRSTQPILAAANAVIGLAAERFTKDLWSDRASSDKPQLVLVSDETSQAHYISGRILENREDGQPLKAQAVLFRASNHSGPLEVELTRRNIPFVKFGGLKFLDSAHIRDVIAVPALGREPARPAGRVPGRSGCCRASDRRRRRPCST
ncbi:MAG: ATP-dependent helicase [Aliidongia sp.]